MIGYTSGAQPFWPVVQKGSVWVVCQADLAGGPDLAPGAGKVEAFWPCRGECRQHGGQFSPHLAQLRKEIWSKPDSALQGRQGVRPSSYLAHGWGGSAGLGALQAAAKGLEHGTKAVGEGGHIKLQSLPYHQIFPLVGSSSGWILWLHGPHLAHGLEVESTQILSLQTESVAHLLGGGHKNPQLTNDCCTALPKLTIKYGNPKQGIL